jgi:hypothetical protein
MTSVPQGVAGQGRGVPCDRQRAAGDGPQQCPGASRRPCTVPTLWHVEPAGSVTDGMASG